MNRNILSTMHNEIPAAADDGRSFLTVYIDAISELARMASINYVTIEKALCPSRAVDKTGMIYTFKFSDRWVDDIDFMSRNIEARAQALADSVDILRRLEVGQ